MILSAVGVITFLIVCASCNHPTQVSPVGGFNHEEKNLTQFEFEEEYKTKPCQLSGVAHRASPELISFIIKNGADDSDIFLENVVVIVASSENPLPKQFGQINMPYLIVDDRAGIGKAKLREQSATTEFCIVHKANIIRVELWRKIAG